MVLERKNLLGTLIGQTVDVKEIALGQADKIIPCLSTEGEEVRNIYDEFIPRIGKYHKADIKNLNIRGLPTAELYLSGLYGCSSNTIRKNDYLYLWYVFTNKKNSDEYNIIKKYSINKEKVKRYLGINIVSTGKNNFCERCHPDGRPETFKVIYNVSTPVISYKEVIKCVAFFCVKEGVETIEDRDDNLSDVDPEVCNEYLMPRQDSASSYKWDVLRCSYVQEEDGKKYNKIVNMSFGDLWTDFRRWANADIDYDKSKTYIKYLGTNENLDMAKRTGLSDEKQAGDNIFEVSIGLSNANKNKFKGLDGIEKNLQIDILDSLKNGNVKELIENQLPNRSLGTINIKKGTDFYNGLGIKKYNDGIVSFDRMEGTNIYGLLKVFEVPLKKENLKGEAASKVINCADVNCDRIEKGYGYVFLDSTKQSNFISNTKEDLDLFFKSFLKQKCEIYAESLNRIFRNKVKKIYGTQGKTYLAGTNMESAGVIEFLNVVLLMMLVKDNYLLAENVCDKLAKSGINKDTSSEAIAREFKNILEDSINDKFKNSSNEKKAFDFNTVKSDDVAGMLLFETDKIKSDENAKKQKKIKDVVFTCTCKARRKLKIYSLSKMFDDEIIEGYRLATIIPYNEPLQEIGEEDYEGINIQQVEDFIQTWMVRPTSTTNKKPPLPVPIEGYYDMLNGMTPYVKYSFRESCNSMSKITESGKEYVVVKNDKDDISSRYIKKDDGNYYKVSLNGEKKEVTDGYGNKKTIIEYKEIEGAKAYSYKELCQSLVNSFKEFDTISYPYFKSLQIEDTGVKKITLTLFDPDFGSFNIDRKGSVFSLESVIRGALRNPYFEKTEEEDNSYYDASIDYSGGIESGYLDIKEGASELSPTNLKIRFGYTPNENIIKGKTGFKERFAARSLKNARWWDEEQVGSVTNVNIKDIKKYIKNGEIQNQEARWVSIKDLGVEDNNPKETNTNDPYNELGGNLSVNSMLASPFQTTVLSREYSFMIIGFNTEFTQNGIQYTIQAIESKDAVTLKTRFLQRYSEITANPEEVLYNLMHVFNEDNEGKNIENSKVKICLVEDVDDNYMKDALNMKYDFKKMKNEKLLDGEAEVEDLYSAACFEKGVVYKTKYLKDITLKFGSEEAIKNYSSNRGKNNPPLYKTVAQLMNEFCASCPPKVEKKWKNVKDENGQSIISDNGNCAARPLKWFTFEDTKNNIVYICLYYRRTKKVGRIRVYTWGPNNPTTSCVKSVSLKNANEFAILSAVDAFKTGDGIIPRDTCMTSAGVADINSNGRQEIKPTNYNAKQVNIAGTEADEYLNAFSSSMYNVTMGILGDPSLCFDGELQPFTYPIELDLLMPQNEFTRRVLAGEQSDTYGKQVENLINKNMSRFKSWYTGSAFYNNYKSLSGMKEMAEKNQILHEASGFYVISKITHNIDAQGFNTNLELVSYPNIAADVIGGVREKQEKEKHKK